ncbi:signal recognition particle protein [Blattabacterium cuenoti]|uniref:signal recognition particle protein n=1 Tax=Blattabacterium cuenoti TaxID=1653831 RepID=UPI00163BA87E|nr:signal recognition particle protein [Blattabacterium cuenoti]
MFKTLQDKIQKAINVLKGNHQITEINLASSIKEVGRALIDADVNYKIVKKFIKKIKEKSIGKKVLTSLNPRQLIIKIVYDELVTLMGGKNVELNIYKTPFIILICGLQGSGKTSFSSKLSFFLKKKGYSPLLVAADIHRPAAVDQLNFLAKKICVPVFSLEKINSYDHDHIANIVEKSIDYAFDMKKDVVIIDTAGRLAIDEIMMKEIKIIKKHSNPNEILFVIDSMTGQDAINTAKSFYESLNFDGIVMTKLDGDSKGGAAITISSIINKPIKFISNGEKIEDIEIFHPDRIANRIIGMGDIISLVEKVQEQFNEKNTKEIYHKMSKNRFDFNDFLEQIKQIKKIGNIKNIISMIPGVDKYLPQKNREIDNKSFKKMESIIFSMTPYERKNPKILSDISRKKRISKGSGISLDEINFFLKQFKDINKIMKKIKTNSGKDLIKNFISEIFDKRKM